MLGGVSPTALFSSAPAQCRERCSDCVHMPIPWPLTLYQRPRAGPLLAGIDVFHDFVWRELFNHNLGAFQHGKSLASRIRSDAPTGKRPTLLLTDCPGKLAHNVVTDARYVAIVPIREYLASSGADPASSYYARTSTTGVSRLADLRDVDLAPVDLQHILSRNLTSAALSEWASATDERQRILRELASALPDTSNGDVTADVISSTRDVSDASLAQLVEVLRQRDAGSYVGPLLSLLEASAAGRTGMARSLGAVLPDRMRDIRDQISQYETLIRNPTASETDVQLFLEHCPWIVGLPYVRTRGRVPHARGTLDFVLDRFDGFFDIVELKGPREPIVVDSGTRAEGARPSAPSSLALGPALSNALAQAHMYRSVLRASNDLRTQYGLSDTRHPRIIILIGLAEMLTDNGKDVLRELNLSLHRVEVIPYDHLGERLHGMVRNIERLLTDLGTDSTTD